MNSKKFQMSKHEMVDQLVDDELGKTYSIEITLDSKYATGENRVFYTFVSKIAWFETWGIIVGGQPGYLHSEEFDFEDRESVKDAIIKSFDFLENVLATSIINISCSDMGTFRLMQIV